MKWWDNFKKKTVEDVMDTATEKVSQIKSEVTDEAKNKIINLITGMSILLVTYLVFKPEKHPQTPNITIHIEGGIHYDHP